MKFVITYTDGWHWNLTASNGKIICSGESYTRPQKMIATLNKYIVRDDEYLAASLEYELSCWGLTATGTQLKD